MKLATQDDADCGSLPEPARPSRCRCGRNIRRTSVTGFCISCLIQTRKHSCIQCGGPRSRLSQSRMCFDCCKPRRNTQVMGIGFVTQRKLALCCEVFGIKREVILGRTRGRDIILARHALIVALRRDTTWSLAEIGRRLGLNHTSVRHGIKAAGERAKGDPDYAAQINALCMERAA